MAYSINEFKGQTVYSTNKKINVSGEKLKVEVKKFGEIYIDLATSIT